MAYKTLISERRAYRSLEFVKITAEVIKDLAESAQLAPSCFNYQPWRFVFVYDKEILMKLYETLSKTNVWAHYGSMIIAVFSRKDLDCISDEREYYLFDTGMATALLILRATDLGLVAHPIAGFNEKKVKKTLGIPNDMRVITLIIVGKHSRENMHERLSERQIEVEKKRPERKALEEFVYLNRYKE